MSDRSRDRVRRERHKQGYSIGEAAKLLGSPVVTVRFWMDKGKIKGVRRTEGGQRWITRENLLAFARERGIECPTVELRRSPRMRVFKTSMQIKVLLPDGKELGCGEGRLWDMSQRGFRADRVHWQSPLTPRIGTVFAFETSRGRWPTTNGLARLAWHLDNRRTRGAVLGASIQRFEDKRAEKTWEKRLAALN